MRATLSAASLTEVEVEETPADGQADRLAGEGETLRIHEPAVDPTLAERIRIPLGRDDVYADIYIRECDGTACVIYSGEVVATIDDQLSRHGAISEAVRTLYQYFMGTGEQSKKILAGRLNAYIANTIDDPTKIVPAGESCEWPVVEVVEPDIAAIEQELRDWPGSRDEDIVPANLTNPLVSSDEPPTDDTTDDSDINADGDVECKADTPSSASPTDEFPNLVPLEAGATDPAAVEIVAVAEGEGATSAAAGAADQACGEKGVVGLREVDAEELLAIEKAQHLYHRAHTAAKDSYVAASQYRVQLQGDVKQAKDEEAKLLEEIGRIENRGWRAFLTEKSKPAPTADAPAPSIPSPPSTLPPPSPESATPSSPQAGAAHAATSAAPAANGTGYRDDWESVDIAELKLPKGTTTILREAGCGTMGALEKKRGSFDGLTSIAGIGETKRDAIEEAILGWLSKNRDASTINAVREANHRAAVEGEGLALEMAAQGQ